MKKILEKKQNGITLIALVITIIVLIILAGVAINLTLGQNGLLNRTKEAREKYEIASAKEYIELKIDECIIEKGGEASLQDIIDYLAEDSNVTYYVALEEVGLVAGEVDIGSPKEIYVVYNSYQFKINESKNVEFISIVDVDLEGKVSIEAQVEEHLGKNADEKYEARVLLKATGDAEISKLEIQNPDGTSLTLEPDGLTTVGKDMTIEFDKTYKVILTTANGHRYSKKIIEKSEETIMNAEQLASFRDRVNSGLTYEGKTVKLGADIDLSTVCGENVGGKEVSWEPIGTETTSFKGTFDGNNKTINNIYINTNKDYQALFGFNYGILRKIKISGEKINGGKCTAGISSINFARIENCENNVNEIIGTETTGGITAANRKIVLNSCNTANVIGSGSAQEISVGGVVGNCNGEMYGCYNTGNITGNMNGTHNINVGGVTGYVSGGKTIVEGCYNSGNINCSKINSNNTQSVRIGGVTGTIYPQGATLRYSYSIGDVQATDSGNFILMGKSIGYSCYGTATKVFSNGGTVIGREDFSNTSEINNVIPTPEKINSEYFTNDIKEKVVDESTGTEKEVWKYNNGYPILKWQLQENQVAEKGL